MTVKHLPTMQETRVQSLGWEDPPEGNGNPLQYACLENSTDGGAWWATVHGVARSQTRLSDFTFFLSFFLSPAWSGLPSRGTQKAGWGGKKVKHRIRLKFGVYEDGDWRITSLLGRRGHGKNAISDSLWGSGLM